MRAPAIRLQLLRDACYASGNVNFVQERVCTANGVKTGFRFRRETRFIRFVVCMRIVLVTDFNLGPTRFARLDRNGACKRSLKTSQNGFHVPSPNSFSPVLGVLNANRLPFQVETAPERS